MAAKKYKPALFELVNRGARQPVRQTALRTPRWMDKQNVAPPQAPVAEDSPEMPADHDSVEKAPMVETEDAGRLTIAVSYWTAGAGVLAIIFTLLVAYNLGLRSGRQSVTARLDPMNTPPSQELREVAEAAARPDLVTPTARRDTPTPATPATPTAPAATTTQPAAARATRSGHCFIICSLERAEDLRYLQQHFANQGIMTEIGRFGGGYVLHTARTFADTQDSAAAELKRNIIAAGAGYNSNRPAQAPIISASTFQSAYLVDIGRIQPLGN